MGRHTQPHRSHQVVMGSLLFSLLLISLSSCGSTTTALGGGVSPWGLPFRTGTLIKIGTGDGLCAPGALHDDNFRSVPGYQLGGAGCTGEKHASLDLITQQSGVPVIPIASGRVLKAWPECRMVLVDHGNGVWVTYLHLQLAISGTPSVNRDTVLGYTLPPYDARKTNCGDYSTAPHLHFAFLHGSGTSGQYVPMQGTTLCGHAVAADGSLVGLGSPGDTYFSVPNCDAPSPSETPRDGEQFVSQSANPTRVSLGQAVGIFFEERNTGNRNWSDSDGYALVCHQNCFGVSRVGFGGRTVPPNDTFRFTINFPTSISPGTYRTVWAMAHNGKQFGHDLWIDIVVQQNAPPPQSSSCSTPTLQAPGIASYAQNADITLVWSTNCPQSYAELWGGPYGTLNFGGWQTGNSIHIGQMNAGTFMWHVKGRTSNGTETGWSTTWSFGIASPPPPTPTPTPTPTSAPPTPTPTPTQCPYRNNYGQFPTFYAQPNYQGQSVTFSINPGEDKFFTLPSGIQGNLGSFTDPYGAFHIVTYHGVNHDGNMAHWDASNPGPLPDTDGYKRSDSVEIYFRRC